MPADGAARTSTPLLVAAQMREIEAQVRSCPLCRLSKTRTNAVPGEGEYGAEVMFIGEGPGYHEDRQGRPFVGAAGQFLNELLAIAGLARSSVFVTNVVKCRPPNNRDPMPDEIAACSGYLDRQIALVNPRVIVTLGRYSMARFFPGERISAIHGQARVVEGRLCVAMYHPAAGLHQASLADVIRADFRKLPLFITQARKMGSAAQPTEGTPPTPAEAQRPAPAGPSSAPSEQGVAQEATVVATSPTPTPTPTPTLSVSEPSPPPANGGKPAGRKKKERGEEYRQLSLFDTNDG